MSTNANQSGVLQWRMHESVVVSPGEGAGEDDLKKPSRRSGHSFTIIGSNGFLFGGCDYSDPPGPSDDLYKLKISSSGPFEWQKVITRTTPMPRWKHSATIVDTKIFVFGGFYSSTNRFNDLWIFNPITMEWMQPVPQQANFTPRGNHTQPKSAWPGCPSPRGAHSACLIGDEIYIFGGYGGAGYSRRDFDDMYALNTLDMTWIKVPSKGKTPEKRSGHQACGVDMKMFIFGGWNSYAQFNDLHVFDVLSGCWSALEGPHFSTNDPRWNHSSCPVMAIPNAKIFIFGGRIGNSLDYTAQGIFTNNICLFDTGCNKWTIPSVSGEIPPGRSDTVLSYDTKGSRLIVFGGWANFWLNDIYSLDVSCVVGPPYAILSVFPTEGPITGGLDLTIEGIDFMNKPVTVRFSSTKGAVDVAGVFMNDHTITTVTPDFSNFPPGKVDVRVAMLGDSYTTTFQCFNFFSVSDANFCFAFGPGLINGGTAGDPTMFVIQARDSRNFNRTTGGDEFLITVNVADGSAATFIPVTTECQGDGTYIVSYSVPKPARYNISVEFLGTFGGISGSIRGTPVEILFSDNVGHAMNEMNGKLVKDQLGVDIQYLNALTLEYSSGLDKEKGIELLPADAATLCLIEIKKYIFQVETEGSNILLAIDKAKSTVLYMKDMGSTVTNQLEKIELIENSWKDIVNKSALISKRIAPLVSTQKSKLKAEIKVYDEEVELYYKTIKTKAFWEFSTGADASLRLLEETRAEYTSVLKKFQHHQQVATIFSCLDLLNSASDIISTVDQTIERFESLWNTVVDVGKRMEYFHEFLWSDIDTELLEDEAKSLMSIVKSCPRDIRESSVYKGLEKVSLDFQSTCPLIHALHHESFQKRHWVDVVRVSGKSFTIPDENPDLNLGEVLSLNLHEFQHEIEEISDRAQKEMKQERLLNELEARWSSIEYKMTLYDESSDIPLLHLQEDDLEILEADQLVIQGMLISRFNFFKSRTESWQENLSMIMDVSSILVVIQRTWSYLEPLFVRSEDVRKELPDVIDRFSEVDKNIKSILKEMWAKRVVLECCRVEGIMTTLSRSQKMLEQCQQLLMEYLDSKKKLFPRFYFTSEADLLEILSNGSQPAKILPHINKIFLATKTFMIDSNNPTTISAFVSSVGDEVVYFDTSISLEGKVENYLQKAHSCMKNTLQDHLKRSLLRYPELSRCEWLLSKVKNNPSDPAQISLIVSSIEFVREVEHVFDVEMKEGNTNALKDYNEKLRLQLCELIELIKKPSLTIDERQRVMCMITMDAHSRDVVKLLINESITNKKSFQWQSQLKHRHGPLDRATIYICDAEFDYGFEYLGNGPRLVITPLTDRIYVTATQALSLHMGCGPTGPAGTGKTETTKDLASSLGKVCYVFNCSPEMDYKSLGDIFKGLASSGSWGCFDEFNRLALAVMSVCSVQFKSICDGIRQNADSIVIEVDEISLDPSCGTFFTMNPGYLGRSELPEGLKTLLRPISVVVPDLVLICENILMAEGFSESSILASKFYSLYSLLSELLSKQAHYDWGLRAIKSVLTVAGMFRRSSEPQTPETDILMKALRDFNIPKIVKQDQVIFEGLMADLFPNTNSAPSICNDLEKHISTACEEKDLWPDAMFCLKVRQVQDIISIRHCVFIMGPPGCGKSETIKTLGLARGLANEDWETQIVNINPKAVSTEELYGYIMLGTREWIDGLLPKIMREYCRSSEHYKWIVFDGDLDANWIESMNSVMDDNRMLTLASNERIPLKDKMKLIFEIRDLKYATPATVSRAGVVYIATDEGYQWRSAIASWLNTNHSELEEANRQMLGEMILRYTKPTLEFLKKKIKGNQIFQQDISLVQMLLSFLDALLEDMQDAKKVESLVCFCSIWAFGSSLSVSDDGTDYRSLFSEWWRSTFKNVKIPVRDTVFDYWLSSSNSTFDTWKSSPYFGSVLYDGSVPMTSITVPTSETASITSWIDLLIQLQRPVLLVGLAGTGKTQLINGILNKMDASDRTFTTINCNFYTNSATMQEILESKLSKRMGSTYGPTCNVDLVYFIDDLNLPEVDAYNTQSAHALIRQHMDYGHWYDRKKLTPKQIVNCQYVSCLNPTAGSFFINPRLQRHFSTFVLGIPSSVSLLTIYQTFLDGHLQDFVDSVRKVSTCIVKATLSLHSSISSSFRKTTTNFHYEFNLRHLSNVFQGLLVSSPSYFGNPTKFSELWLHEMTRVYGDRLSTNQDFQTYNELAQIQAKKHFPNANFTSYFSMQNPDPLVFCNFLPGRTNNELDQAISLNEVFEVVQESLCSYNDQNPKMNLVLFNDAVLHVARICRIIAISSAHAMLIGVGGSGRKSLARLSAHISSYSIFEIVLTHSYSLLDFKNDLQSLFSRTGLQNEGLLFIMSDGQVINERFLVFINDILSSGFAPNLYTPDEKSAILDQIRTKSGLSTDNECWQWFIHRIKANLHLALCFSPVGSNFRSRARKFPALVSCTMIDWFHSWPAEALSAVAETMLTDVRLGGEIVQAIQAFMPFCFESVNQVCHEFLRNERRYVYTTPKSYLELLNLYCDILDSKQTELHKAANRLQSGISKLNETSDVVANIEEELQKTLELGEKKQELAEEMALRVKNDKEFVEKNTLKANQEALITAEIQAEVAAKQKDTEADLAIAEPMVEGAMAALNTLNKKDLGSCKTMTKPPTGVDDVFAAVVVLLAGVNANIIVQKNGKVKEKDRTWESAKKVLLGNINQFVDDLKNFKTLVDTQAVPEINWKEVRPFLSLEHFTVETIEKKNSAAAGLCSWVLNIVAYYDVFLIILPKRIALEECNKKFEIANKKLQDIRQKVLDLEEKLARLNAEYEKTLKDVENAHQTVSRGKLKMELATRLTDALSDESKRWSESIESISSCTTSLPGDVLLATAFISYVGPFTKPYRDELVNKKWIPFLQTAMDDGKSSIPMSQPCVKPVNVLIDDAQKATWSTQGLPSDVVSIENGAIVCCSHRRWPFLIDPQLQGIHWLREKGSIQIIGQQQQSSTLLRTLESCIENGQSLLIESMSEHIEFSLWPIISRNVKYKAKKPMLKLGDKDIALHPDFHLYLHTKLSNPHFPPEVQAETNLINFSVTPLGLEDQLLHLVIRKEQPDKAKLRMALVQQQNQFKIKLKFLEDSILSKLTDTEGEVTEDVTLIEDLEASKITSSEIEEKVTIARATEAAIVVLSDKYRRVAARGSLLFFMMINLHKVHSYYSFSLNAFVVIFARGIDLVTPSSSDPVDVKGLNRFKAAAKRIISTQRFNWNTDLLLADMMANEELEFEDIMQSAANATTTDTENLDDISISQRCAVLSTSITDVVFNYLCRGLFEKDKLMVATQLMLLIGQQESELNLDEVSQLISNASVQDSSLNMGGLREWMTNEIWYKLQSLEKIGVYKNICDDMRSSTIDWQEWFEQESPEIASVPTPYDKITSFQKLLILRAMRPDRVSFAMKNYIEQYLGKQFTQQQPFDIEATYQESSAATPILFILSPGIEPTAWVETLGQKFNISSTRGNLMNISMGQGQDKPAELILQKCSLEGNWAMIQNIHLMTCWLPKLEQLLESFSSSADLNFRCFLSVQAPILSSASNIPESLLQSCIKVSNESPADLKTNLRRSWANFSTKMIDECLKPNEYQGCLFGLCFYHAIVVGRRRFGAIGWSQPYSFNTGDLSICADVLKKYLDRQEDSNNDSIPWQDLRYIFGEIMYGGHITDFWDRRMNKVYLKRLFSSNLLKEKMLCPGFDCLDPFVSTYGKYRDHIDTKLPNESASIYGLHSNVEMNYLTKSCENLFSFAESKHIPNGEILSTGVDQKTQEMKAILENLLGRLPESFDLQELRERANPLMLSISSPYVAVALQECTRMQLLIDVIRDTLEDLNKSLNGQLNMSDAMEDMMASLLSNKVPGRTVLNDNQKTISWEKFAWASTKPLGSWFIDCVQRAIVLASWVSDFALPFSMWLPGLFNPTAFLTAIKQVTARSQHLPLDCMTIETHVTNFNPEDGIDFYPTNGAFVHGFYLEGAGWITTCDKSSKMIDNVTVDATGCLGIARLKDKNLPAFPVCYIRAVPIEPEWTPTSVGYFRQQESIYECPVYVTSTRGPTFVFMATLANDPQNNPNMWILAGVALLMQRD